MAVFMQNSVSRPIIYRGTPFRSRMEARWAYFWDQLGVKWEYEKYRYIVARVWDEELPYKLRKPIAYTPDFYLPEYDLFVEVKGPEPVGFEKEKARMLALITNRPVTIVYNGLRSEQLKVMTYAKTGGVSTNLNRPIMPWPGNWPGEVIRQILREASGVRYEYLETYNGE